MISIENLKREDFSTICRICFKKGDLKEIFKTVIEGVKIVDIFEDILNEQVIFNKYLTASCSISTTDFKIIKDEKPQNICRSCIDLLVQLNTFLKLYSDSKNALQTVLELRKTDDTYQCNSIEKVEVDIKKEIKSDLTEQIEDICYFCNFHFTTDPSAKKVAIHNKDLLQMHTRTEHLLEIFNNKWNCIKCKNNFPSLHEIQKHFFTSKHQSKTCLKCKRKSNTIKECFAHMQSCKIKETVQSKVDEIYNCIHCNEKLKLFENVIAHYREKHSLNNACMLCNRIYVRRMYFHLYSKKHRPHRMKFFCSKCFMYYGSENELFEHKLLDDHSVKKCEICKETYTGRRENHEEKHRKEPIICELCGTTFKHRPNLFRHYKAAHLGRRFYCDQCPKSHTKFFDLKQHIERDHPGNAVKAPLKTTRNKKLKTQIKKTKIRQIKYFTCPVCNKKIPSCNKKRIKMHRIFHESGDKLKCLASECDLTFPDIGSRLEHMSQSHKRFTCDECQKEFFTIEQFQTHCSMHIWQREASASKSPLDNCLICRESFENMKSLTDHTWKKHKIYLCPVEACGAVFRSSAQICRHKKGGIHGNSQFKYSCTVCGEKFKTESRFSAHQKRHDDKNRKHKCSVCQLSFVTADQLKVHSRRHTGEKPYGCRFCNKRFVNVSGQTLHERVHTGEKPFSCPHCDKKFADGTYCKRHILQHEKELMKSNFKEELSN